MRPMKVVNVDLISPIQRKILLGLADASLTLLSAMGAVVLTNSLALFTELNIPLWVVIISIVGVRLAIYISVGLFDLIWKYASIFELKRILRSTVIGSLTLFIVSGVMNSPGLIRFCIAEALLNFLAIGGIRFSLRLYRDYLILSDPKHRGGHLKEPVLIIGAGDAGNSIVRELNNNPRATYSPVGFIDDDPKKYGKKIHGIPVLGGMSDLAQLAAQCEVSTVIIAIPSAPGDKIRSIVSDCENASLATKITPSLSKVLSGITSLSQVRDVDIEDLLGRTEVRLDVDSVSTYLSGARVMVTGAGGSIGSELCRQIAKFSPANLILVDHAETPLFHIDLELRSTLNSIAVQAVVADVKDLTRLTQVFDNTRPTIVFHAAAYKHVPMMEDNVEEAILNNILGTRNMLQLSGEHRVSEFVLISTDKAVRPTNVMGGTKRLCEVLNQLAATQFPLTRFAAVRFGNVLGSQGSVIPLFKKQIEHGGPITVTHPEITRYFMTIPEAIRLIIQAGALCRGGELFILDMGQPVKIVNLAKDLIRLSGFQDGQIPIRFTGLRPGEKLFEELYFDARFLTDTPHNQIFVTRPSTQSLTGADDEISAIIDGCFRIPSGQLKSQLMALVDKFSPVYQPVNQSITESVT